MKVAACLVFSFVMGVLMLARSIRAWGRAGKYLVQSQLLA